MAALLLFVGGAIAAGGGVGGGAVFVPILVLLGGFETTHAVPLSNLLIVGASLANYLLMFRKKHPYANRPLVDYDTAMLLQPMSLAGTVLGVFLNQVFPSWLILALLIITLGMLIALCVHVDFGVVHWAS